MSKRLFSSSKEASRSARAENSASRGEIWQVGFSEVRIFEDASFAQHKNYIENNPVKRGLVSAAEEYPFGSIFLKALKRKEAQGLKPQ